MLTRLLAAHEERVVGPALELGRRQLRPHQRRRLGALQSQLALAAVLQGYNESNSTQDNSVSSHARCAR